MNRSLYIFIIFLSLSVLENNSFAQITIKDNYLIINAKTNDPLFTTYAAAMERSRFFADKSYFMEYFTPDKPITYTSQYSGDLAVIWKVNNMVISKISDFIAPPVVVASFPDMAIIEYAPFDGIHVQEIFFVFSSGAAIIDLRITNKSNKKSDIVLYPLLHLPQDSLNVICFDSTYHGYLFSHYESPIRVHSNLYGDRGYPTNFRNLLSCDSMPNSYGAYRGCDIQDFYFAAKNISKVYERVVSLNQNQHGQDDIVALQKNIILHPNETKTVRFVRGVQDAKSDETELMNDVQSALKINMQMYVDKNVQLFATMPRIKFKTVKEKIVYLSAFNLARQCMLPPSGQTSRNFYVFSRNPMWGWGHGHQVMHESISMIPYAYLDWKSAQESQRIYIDQQFDDGLIAYRHGPRGAQVYPHEGKATTSAPFFSWTNWEIYQVSIDKTFLKDSYNAGAKYIRFMETERDKDHDGMFEWGPYGIIENVRDGWNVVFQLFSEGEDEGRDISGALEALDLTTQMANEMYYLKLMAKEVGDAAGEKEWSDKFEKVSKLMNQYMWDPIDKFYYHVAMSDHTFNFEGRSLKRKEIIGLLTMWARVASKEQAKELVKHLENTNSFWRKYGVPTLAADDPHYIPYVDGCCRWNGPIWLLWDYMVMVGLNNYGYNKQANLLADKMMLAVTTQLEKNHRFWESYSPDYPVQESPSNYIWDSIMARVLIDMYRK